MRGIESSMWADTPPQASSNSNNMNDNAAGESRATEKPSKAIVKLPEPEQKSSKAGEESGTTNEAKQDSIPTEPAAPEEARQPAPPPASKGGRKRVLCKGKTIVIAPPANDDRGNGVDRPRLLSAADVNKRLQAWQEQGYDVRGFGYWKSPDMSQPIELDMHNIPIHPPAEDMSAERQAKLYRVYVPDISEWDLYVTQLNEERLRALGVSSSDDQRTASASLSPTTTMSRQTSSRHPLLPTSPPPLTLSSASNQAGRLPTNPFAPPSYAPHHLPDQTGIVKAMPAPFSNAVPAAFLGWPVTSQVGFSADPLQGISPSRAGHLPMSPPDAWQRFSPSAVYRGASPGALSRRASLLASVSHSPVSMDKVATSSPLAGGSDVVGPEQHQNGPAKMPLPQESGVRDGESSKEPEGRSSLHEQEGGHHAESLVQKSSSPEVTAPAAEPEDNAHMDSGSVGPSLHHNPSEAATEQQQQQQGGQGEDSRVDSSSPFDSENVLPDNFVTAPVNSLNNGTRDKSDPDPDSMSDAHITTAKPAIPLHSPQPRSKRHLLSTDLGRDSSIQVLREATRERALTTADLADTEPQKTDLALSRPRLSPTSSQPPPRPMENVQMVSGASVGRSQPMPRRPPVRKTPVASSASLRLNVEAEEFKYDPEHALLPSTLSHRRGISAAAGDIPQIPPAHPTHAAPAAKTGSKLNVKAAAFTPRAFHDGNLPTKEFSFSLASAANKLADAPSPDAGSAAQGKDKIFDYDRIVLPPKTSKAVPIIIPDEAVQEEESGRVTRGQSRHKKLRRNEKDADDIPQFALPSPPPRRKEDQPPTSHPDAEPTETDSSRPAGDENERTLDRVSVDADKSQLNEQRHEISKPKPEKHESTQSPVRTVEPAADGSAIERDILADDKAPSTPTSQTDNVLQKNKSAATTEDQIPDTAPTRRTSISGGKSDVTESSTRVLSKTDNSSSTDSTIKARPLSLLANKDLNRLASKPLVGKRDEVGLRPAARIGSSDDRERADMLDDSSPSNTVQKPGRSSSEENEKQTSQEEAQAARRSPGSSYGKERIAGAELNQSNPRPGSRTMSTGSPPTRRNSLALLNLHRRADRSSIDRTSEVATAIRRGSTAPSHRSAPSEVISPNGWDRMVSPSEDMKFQSPSQFFDGHIDRLLQRLLDHHLLPVEKMLSNMQDLMTVVVQNTLPSKGRDGTSTRASESDADDEEEDHQVSGRARAKLPRIDAVVEKLKAALQEDIVARAAAAQALAPPVSEISDIRRVLVELKESSAVAASAVAAAQPVAPDFDMFRRLVEEATAKSLSLHHEASNSAQLVKIGELERVAATLNRVLGRAEDNARVQIRMSTTVDDGAAELQKMLRLAQADAAHHKALAEAKERELRRLKDAERLNLEHAQKQAQAHVDALDQTRDAFQSTASQLTQDASQVSAQLRDLQAAEARQSDFLNKLEAMTLALAGKDSPFSEQLQGLEVLQRAQREAQTALGDSVTTLSGAVNEFTAKLRYMEELRRNEEEQARERDETVEAVKSLQKQLEHASQAQEPTSTGPEDASQDQAPTSDQTEDEDRLSKLSDVQLKILKEFMQEQLESNARAQAQLADQNTEVESLRRGESKLGAKCEQLERAAADMETLVTALRQENNGLQQANVKLHAEVGEAKAAGHSEAERAKLLWEAKCEQLERSTADMGKSIEALRHDNTALQQANARYEAEVAEAKAAGRAETERVKMLLETKCEQLERRNHELETLVGALRSENHGLSQANVKCMAEIHEAKAAGRAEIERTKLLLEAQCEQLKRANTDVEKLVEDVRSENKSLHHAINKYQGELEEAKAAARTDIEHAKLLSDAKCEQLERSNKDLLTQVEALRHDNKDLLEANVRYQAETSEAKAAGQAEIERTKLLAEAKYEQLERSNVDLITQVEALRRDNKALQEANVRYQAEASEAQAAGQAELERTKLLMEAEAKAARSEAERTRADLESDLARVRMDLEYQRLEAESAETRLQLQLEEAASSKSSALQAAAEDKRRLEEHLLDRLGLADGRAAQLQERIELLEDKLKIARSAANAAAQAAQQAKSTAPPPAATGLPHERADPVKVSPQALRESIMVLQEQLQEREGRIDALEQQLQQQEADREAPARVKEQQIEIGWLRELLELRASDLGEIIRALSTPGYDGVAVRDAAIRLKASLEMEQQERERAAKSGSSGGGGGERPRFPSIGSVSSSLTSSKAVLPLAAAWGSWRKGRNATNGSGSGGNSPNPAAPSSSSLGTRHSASATDSTAAAAAAASQTPSRPPPQPALTAARGLLSGIMTPPGTNSRDSPGFFRAHHNHHALAARGRKSDTAVLRNDELDADGELSPTLRLLRLDGGGGGGGGGGDAAPSSSYSAATSPAGTGTLTMLGDELYDLDAHATDLNGDFHPSD